MKETIRIPQKDWEFLRNEVSKFKRDKDVFLVFALFSKRRTHWDIVEITKIPISLKQVKSGYTYTYPGIKKLGFYPPPNSPKRFCGTFVFGDSVELSLEDAYWMGRDRVDCRIKMDVSGEGKPEYKAWAFDPTSDEVCEVNIEIV